MHSKHEYDEARCYSNLVNNIPTEHHWNGTEQNSVKLYYVIEQEAFSRYCFVKWPSRCCYMCVLKKRCISEVSHLFESDQQFWLSIVYVDCLFVVFQKHYNLLEVTGSESAPDMCSAPAVLRISSLEEYKASIYRPNVVSGIVCMRQKCITTNQDFGSFLKMSDKYFVHLKLTTYFQQAHALGGWLHFQANQQMPCWSKVNEALCRVCSFGQNRNKR